MDLLNKKVLLLGFSLTTKKSAEYFINNGANVYITEANGEDKYDKKEIEFLLNKGVKFEFGKHSDEFIQNSSFAIISPSIKENSPLVEKVKSFGIEIFSDIDFLGSKLSYNDKIVLITGTNGKTTTTSLVSSILSKKYFAPATGNIGVPPLSILKDKNPDFFVIEASSYQLHYSRNLLPKISILCNITPDHLAFHGSMENYIKDKTDILKNAKKSSYVILNYDDIYTKTFVSEIKAKVFYFSLNKIDYENCSYIDNGTIYFKNEKIIDIKDIKLQGNHNYQNVMAAIIASKILGLTNEQIKERIMEFDPPRHRLQYITTINQTKYYNDSKATNPEASNVALCSFLGEKVSLIAGGRDKNTPLDEFAQLVKKNIDKVVLIGEAKDRFEVELLNVGFNNIKKANTLSDAIDEASRQNPDVVLFSPACASFDMFDNFEARGECFIDYVLKKRAVK